MFEPLVSSMLEGQLYNPPSKILLLKFKTTGKIYAYYEIPSTLFDDFVNASSHGMFFNEHIKGKFSEEIIAEEQAVSFVDANFTAIRTVTKMHPLSKPVFYHAII